MKPKESSNFGDIRSTAAAELTPRPFEKLQAPAGLSGREGRYRLPGSGQKILLEDDLQAMRHWLELIPGTLPTFRTFRNAVEKLINWAWLERGVAVSSLEQADFMAFRRFLSNPEPADRWTMPVKLSRNSAFWRPFLGALRESAANSTMTSVAAMIVWMHEVGYADIRFAGGYRAYKFGTVMTHRIASRPPVEKDRPWLEARDVTWVWNALKIGKESIRLRMQLEFLLQYLVGLPATAVADLQVNFLERQNGAPWTLLLPYRHASRRKVTVLPPLQMVLSQHLASCGNPTKGPLLDSSASDVQKGNKRCFERAATLAAAAGNADAAVRLQNLPGNALRYALINQTTTSEQRFRAWDLTGALGRAMNEQECKMFLRRRRTVDRESYRLGIAALQPLLCPLMPEGQASPDPVTTAGPADATAHQIESTPAQGRNVV